jgi:hypothetical protein
VTALRRYPTVWLPSPGAQKRPRRLRQLRRERERRARRSAPLLLSLDSNGRTSARRVDSWWAEGTGAARSARAISLSPNRLRLARRPENERSRWLCLRAPFANKELATVVRSRRC